MLARNYKSTAATAEVLYAN